MLAHIPVFHLERVLMGVELSMVSEAYGLARAAKVKATATRAEKIVKGISKLTWTSRRQASIPTVERDQLEFSVFGKK